MYRVPYRLVCIITFIFVRVIFLELSVDKNASEIGDPSDRWTLVPLRKDSSRKHPLARRIRVAIASWRQVATSPRCNAAEIPPGGENVRAATDTFLSLSRKRHRVQVPLKPLSTVTRSVVSRRFPGIIAGVLVSWL